MASFEQIDLLVPCRVFQCLTFRATGGTHRQRGADVFHIYVLFLIVSGVAMLVMAGIGSRRTPMLRIWNGILGAAFTIYGLYLLLFFKGGHYFFFFYVFILPILMVVRFFRDRSRLNAGPWSTASSRRVWPAARLRPAAGVTVSRRATVSRPATVSRRYGQPRVTVSRRVTASRPETSPRGLVQVSRARI